MSFISFAKNIAAVNAKTIRYLGQYVGNYQAQLIVDVYFKYYSFPESVCDIIPCLKITIHSQMA